ncbi:hypothetical protein TWF481_004976 [Arthrobotrys musiformis]|uniref:Uncharacterized protein n=1 Tax=Arthrobotrys musiformis TaxID=47236 RepID=A0AAV9WL53_9PEZI
MPIVKRSDDVPASADEVTEPVGNPRKASETTDNELQIVPYKIAPKNPEQKKTAAPGEKRRRKALKRKAVPGEPVEWSDLPHYKYKWDENGKNEGPSSKVGDIEEAKRNKRRRIRSPEIQNPQPKPYAAKRPSFLERADSPSSSSSEEPSFVLSRSDDEENDRIDRLFLREGLTRKYIRRNFARKNAKDLAWLRTGHTRLRCSDYADKAYRLSPTLNRGKKRSVASASGEISDQSSEEELVFVPSPAQSPTAERSEKRAGDEVNQPKASTPHNAEGGAEEGTRDLVATSTGEGGTEIDKWQLQHSFVSTDATNEWRYEVKVT